VKSADGEPESAGGKPESSGSEGIGAGRNTVEAEDDRARRRMKDIEGIQDRGLPE
jgi:hypothetical protein